MKSIMSQNPCKTCNADVQKGNPYYWQTPCYDCQKKRVWENARNDRIMALEKILGDDYDLDHLRELVEADQDDRCIVLPVKAPCHAWACCKFFPDPFESYYASKFDVAAEMGRGYVLAADKESARAALKGDQRDD